MLSDLAYAENQLGNHMGAYQYLKQALAHYDTMPYPATQPKDSIYDTLVSICNQLNRNEEAFFHAKKSIEDKKIRSRTQAPTPTQTYSYRSTPRKIQKHHRLFTLWGKSSLL